MNRPPNSRTDSGIAPANARVAVTGATGYLGRAVVDRLIEEGIATVALSRTGTWPTLARAATPADADAGSGERDAATFVRSARFDLELPLDDEVLADCSAIVHLAWPTNDRRSASQDRAVAATVRLEQQARRLGLRFVFVSSTSAFDGAGSRYGAAKHQAEQALTTDALIVRLGLVIGDPPGGIVAVLRRAAHLRLLPVPAPDALKVCTTTLASAVDAVVDAALHGTPAPDPQDDPGASVSLRALAMSAAKAEGRTITVLPVPLWATRAGTAVIARLGGPGASLADGLRALMGASGGGDKAQPREPRHLRAIDRVDADSSARIAEHSAALASKPETVQVFRELHDDFFRLEKTYAGGPRGARIELGSGVFPLSMSDSSVLTSEYVDGSKVDLLADGQCLPLRTGAVSALFLQNVFHHFPDPAAFLAEATRVLQPGGVAILLEPYHGAFASVLYPRLFATEGFDRTMRGWRASQSGPMNGANQALSSIVFERDRSLYDEAFPDLPIVGAEIARSWLRYLASGGLNFPRIAPRAAFPVFRAIELRLGKLQRHVALHHFIVLRRR